jgi:hypothetical protein
LDCSRMQVTCWAWVILELISSWKHALGFEPGFYFEYSTH